MSALFFIAGIVVGAVVVSVALVRVRIRLASVSAELEVERRSFDEKAVNVIKAMSADALQANNAAFLELASTKLQGYVLPLKESLDKVDGQVQTLERARQRAFGAVERELASVREGQERLRSATGKLVTALRAPHVRGRWGEVQLRRVVEATGMLANCDFVAQSSVRDAEGALLRPDLVVNLPGGKRVVVDAKVPLAAYLDAHEAEDEDARAHYLAEHARQVREHVGKLAAKAYWRQFTPGPDFVVMFLPDETFLRAAQEYDAALSEDAWAANVVPASPTNLFALLRTVAATWQQETVAQSARAISELGRELYERLGTLGGHVARLGKSLDSAVGAYNDAIGSLETRVLVTARKLEDHGVAEPSLPEIAPLDRQARPLQALELTGELPPADADAA